jgi:group I intron endonuclease
MYRSTKLRNELSTWPSGSYILDILDNCKTPGCYEIRHVKSGKCYIGSAKNLSQRFSEHVRMLIRGDHDNDHLQKSWNRHGASKFTFTVLKKCSIANLLNWEQYFMNARKEEVGWRKLFNMRPNAASPNGFKHSKKSLEKMSRQQSGDGNGFYGKKHSPESIERMRAAKRGKTPWNIGIPHSEETKKKISVANSGRELSEEHKAKIAEASKGRKMSEETKAKLAA